MRRATSITNMLIAIYPVYTSPIQNALSMRRFNKDADLCMACDSFDSPVELT